MVCAMGAIVVTPSAEYKSPGEFKSGKILFVAVTVEESQYVDLAKRVAAAFAGHELCFRGS
jgi:hypothetical protein